MNKKNVIQMLGICLVCVGSHAVAGSDLPRNPAGAAGNARPHATPPNRPAIPQHVQNAVVIRPQQPQNPGRPPRRGAVIGNP